MSTDVVKYAFVAGEVSSTLYGRTDLTKFDFGMSEAKNFFVDYRGGLSTRPGTQFCENVLADTLDTRMTGFAFNPDIEDTYVLLFGHNYIRFLQSGSYVLEAAQNITGATQADPAVLTVVGHGLAAGRWVKVAGVDGMVELNGRTFEVSNPTADTFELKSVPDGANISSLAYGAYTAGGTIQAVYEVTTTYASTDLGGLKFDQYRDRVRITSNDGNIPIRDLTRNDHTNWVLSDVDISPFHNGPSITSSSMSAAGSAETIFSVTAVYADGTESTLGNLYKLSAMVNYPVTEGSVSITWTNDPDAVSYNVWRSVISVSEILSYGSQLGFAGSTTGNKFTDPNIVPDFGKTSPLCNNPFAPGAITSITVTAGGAGYSSTSSITMSGGGSGFAGQVITDAAGAILRVIIKNGGTGYVNPTVSFGGGAGATATVVARATIGTYPAISCIYQQRQFFAASPLNPVTLWGSQYKRFENFNSSDIALDSDSIEFDIDTNAVAPIRHVVVTRGGLLAMTQENVWLVSGSGSDNKPITPTNALADPQTYTGISALEPLRIGSDILYQEGKGYAIRLLTYNEISRIYASEDKSILSSHLFGEGKTLIHWAFQESPYKTVWAVREDGALLAFTIVQAEDVYAWTPNETKGRFLDVVAVHEGNNDSIYFTTQRYINGRLTKFIERLDNRLFVNVEDACCVDCGLSLSGTTPTGGLTITFDGTTYTATRSAGDFTGTEGQILRAANGRFEIATVVSALVATLNLEQTPDNWIPETEDTRTFPVSEGSWTLDTKVTTLSGLDHLEGETVSILGDGSVFPQQVITNGKVILPSGVTRAVVGLPFTCKAKTLPLIVPNAGIESKRKRVVGVAMRLTRSRGLKVGDDYATVYDVPERTDEDWGQPTRLQEGFKQLPIGTTWDEDAFTYFLLTDPVPATLLSLVQDIEVGDEPD